MQHTYSQSPVAPTRVLVLLLLTTSGARAQLPEVTPPPGNPLSLAKAALGKTLFWDEQLSASDTVACGTCHRPEAGGSDLRVRRHPGADGIRGTPDDGLGSPGSPGRGTARRPRSVVGAAFGFDLFWDGRAGEQFVDPLTGETVLTFGAGLETQALAPILHPDEMGRDEGWGWPEVCTKLRLVTPLARSPRLPGRLERWIGGRGYPELFEEAFGDGEVTPVRIALAIATYERTLIPDRAPALLQPEGGPGWSSLELDGLRLFESLNCATCHPPGEGLFTDQAYHYLGTRPRGADPGLAGITGLREDSGRMQTPCLLNVSLRAPFFHGGTEATLGDVIAFYVRGGDNEPNEIGRLDLSAVEQAALVAFLGRPLTDPRLLSGMPPFDRPLLAGEEDPRPQLAAGLLQLAGGQEMGLFTWSGPRQGSDPAPGGFLPVEFMVPDRAVLVGRTLEAWWLGPTGSNAPSALLVRLQTTLPR